MYVRAPWDGILQSTYKQYYESQRTLNAALKP